MKKYFFIIISLFIFCTIFLTGCENGDPFATGSPYIPLTKEETATGTETEPQTETETKAETDIPVIEVFGRFIPADTREISFEFDEIPSFDGLLSALVSFPELASIDLGGFEISEDEKRILTEAFPSAEIKCRAYIELFGKKVYDDAEELLIDGPLDTEELKNALPYLPSLKLIRSDTEIPLDEKDALISENPDITFVLPGFVEISGVKIRDDMRDAVLDNTEPDLNLLMKELRRLPSLKSVSLYGVGYNAAEQAALVGGFPSVRFLWEVEILGERYDSETEDLDLSGKTELTADILRSRLPLMAGLKRIDVSKCSATNEELGALRDEFPGIKIVWLLKLGCKWSLKTDAKAFSVLIYNYDYERMTSDDIQVLKYCTDLQALDLGHQAITDISVIGDYLTELRVLILADNKLNDLTPLTKLKHLHYIELFVNRQLKDVSALGECKELVDVNISYLHNITDISNLFDLPMIERFWIINSENVPADQLDSLRETYKNAVIVTKGKNSLDKGWREHPRYYAMFEMFKKTNFISREFSKYDRPDGADQAVPA